jgi:colanic acid biosynthesis protein WcaH
MLPPEQFLAIVEHTPLVSIDLICRNAQGEVLLGLRNNRPAQGSWFVPGGRIVKDERVGAALQRIAARELGLTQLDPASARPLGVFQHLYEDNFAGRAGIGTHYLVLGYAIDIAADAPLVLDDQHSALRWFSIPELLADAQVHTYTKAYFDAANRSTHLP